MDDEDEPVSDIEWLLILVLLPVTAADPIIDGDTPALPLLLLLLLLFDDGDDAAGILDCGGGGGMLIPCLNSCEKLHLSPFWHVLL